MRYVNLKATLSRCCCDSEDVHILVEIKAYWAQVMKIINKDRKVNHKAWRKAQPDKYGELTDVEIDYQATLQDLEGLADYFVDDAPIMVRDERQAQALTRTLNRLNSV